MSIIRSDMAEGMKADMHTWFWEATDKIYKKLQRYYDKMAEVLPVSEIKGGYWKGTSAIGVTELQDRINYGKLYEDKPQEGYIVYGTIKQKNIAIQVPREMERDWHRTKDWMKDYINKNWPQAVEVSKEKIVANLYNYGGYTSGHTVFNNDDATIPVSTYTSPDLCYDGKPFFDLAGNERTAKNNSTYYNAVALSGVTFANAKAMYILLTSTNNKMENGNPFDNSQDLIVVTHTANKLDWDVVNNSTLNPDVATNPTNPLKGAFKEIIANPYLLTPGFSCIQRKGMGIKFWVSDAKFNFWEENNPPGLWGSVIFDYAICVQNFRPFVGNNAPVSA